MAYCWGGGGGGLLLEFYGTLIILTFKKSSNNFKVVTFMVFPPDYIDSLMSSPLQ